MFVIWNSQIIKLRQEVKCFTLETSEKLFTSHTQLLLPRPNSSSTTVPPSSATTTMAALALPLVTSCHHHCSGSFPSPTQPSLSLSIASMAELLQTPNVTTCHCHQRRLVPLMSPFFDLIPTRGSQVPIWFFRFVVFWVFNLGLWVFFFFFWWLSFGWMLEWFGWILFLGGLMFIFVGCWWFYAQICGLMLLF